MNIRPPGEDILRAAITATINAFFPVLVIFNIVDWTVEQTAALNIFITTIMTLVFLFYPNTSEDG